MPTERNDAERRRHRFSCSIRTGEGCPFAQGPHHLGRAQDNTLNKPALSVRNHAHGDSCFRLARRSNHSRSTHFIPAGGATGRPGFEDRILGPVSGPESGTACPAPHSGVRGTRSQIRGCFWGPKSAHNRGSQRGVRQRFSCTVSQSSSSYPTPTPSSFHSRRQRCVDRRPHQKKHKKASRSSRSSTHTSISRSPKPKQQAGSRKQAARGLRKHAAGKMQMTACSR